MLRELELGKSNAKYVAVTSGLQEGDEIILAPDVLGVPIEVLEERVEEQVRAALTIDAVAHGGLEDVQARLEADLEASLLAFGLDHDDDSLRLHCEKVIRNYDPCISCATHFLRLTTERR